jgi:aryl-alcohol dehydrogenase-like predicted oxidoreductase
MIDKRKFGSTELLVYPLGFGAGQIGDQSLSEKEIDNLLNKILDNGINLIDTARGYGLSEERIGRYISQRRNEFVLSTKIGYGIPGLQDWTYDCIIAGIDEALRLLRTDYIDIVHLHSCPREVLERGEVIEALLKGVESGKVLVPAYSGENEDLRYAIDLAKFKSIQTSINISDQRGIDDLLPKAKDMGMGVIAKRAAANAPWRFSERPYGHYCEEYWLRWEKMNLSFDMDWQEIAVRFAAFSEGVDCCIIGSTKLEHIIKNISFIEKGELPGEIYSAIRNAFKANDENWIGML